MERRYSVLFMKNEEIDTSWQNLFNLFNFFEKYYKIKKKHEDIFNHLLYIGKE